MKKVYKAKEVGKLTGISRSALNYYVREGILPRPIKTKRNMAYYTEDHIFLIRIIKELKEKRFLPLKVIKKILKRKRKVSFEEIYALMEIRGELFPPISDKKAIVNCVEERELMVKTGISPEDLSQLKRLGLVSPISSDEGVFYNPLDAVVVECIAGLRKEGFTEDRRFKVKDILPYAEKIEELARYSLELFASKMIGSDSKESVKAAREGIFYISSLLGVLFKKKIEELTRVLERR